MLKPWVGFVFSLVGLVFSTAGQVLDRVREFCEQKQK